MRRELVILPMPRDEGHAPLLDRSHRDGSRRLPVRRVDDDLFGIVEERIEPGTAEDADRGRREDLPKSASASGTDRERLVRHPLDDVEGMAAVATRVSVGRHAEPSVATPSLSADQPMLM